MVPLLVAIALVAATVSGAQARDGHHPIGGSVTTEVVPGDDSTVTSADAESAQNDLDIILGAKSVSDLPMFRIMAFTMMQVKAPKRTGACLMIASSVHHEERPRWGTLGEFQQRDVNGYAETRALALAAMCLRIVKLMAEIEAEGRPPGLAPARARCCRST